MVLDTSVIIKWIRGTSEIDVDKAIDYYQKFRRGEINLVLPDLLFYELANYTSRQTDNTFVNCQELIENLLNLSVEIVPPDEKMILEIISLARELKISAYDATYLVIAQKYNTKLVTADQKLLHAAPELTMSL